MSFIVEILNVRTDLKRSINVSPFHRIVVEIDFFDCIALKVVLTHKKIIRNTSL